MTAQVKRLKNLSLIAAALVITLALPLSVIGEEIITLTTIMPSQDILKVRKGVVGVNYKDPDYLQVGDIEDNELYIEGKVGIGTTAPDAKLTVVDGAILASGTTGGTPVSGGGTRLMWIPAKAAFRAGHVLGSEWDDANIGSHSVAMGLGATASGIGSVAIGSGEGGAGPTASGSQSVAMGGNTYASGYASVAMGGSTVASGLCSVAMGGSTRASGNFSTAFGRGIEAAGEGSFAIALNDQSGTVVSQANTMAVMGGTVGIGTTSPGATLEVAGILKATELTGAWETSSSSYIRLGDLQITWGEFTSTGSGATATTTLPASFVDTTYSVSLTPHVGDANARMSVLVSRATGTLQAQTYMYSGNSRSAVGGSYIAIGRWQ